MPGNGKGEIKPLELRSGGMEPNYVFSDVSRKEEADEWSRDGCHVDGALSLPRPRQKRCEGDRPLVGELEAIVDEHSRLIEFLGL